MARNGNNLSQVFVANAVLSDNEAMSALSSGEVGIFPNGTNVSDGAAGDVHIDATVATNPQWIPNQIQFAQGRAAGNPIASPLIDTSQITRLDFTTYTAPAKATTGDITITSTANGRYALKIVLRAVGPITNYSEYTSPTNQLNDRTGEIRNYEFTSTAGTADGIADGLIAAINNDAYAFVVATQPTGAAHIQITAKDHGSVFQIIDDSDTALAPTTLVSANWGPTEGVGAGWQVIDDELKCQGRYGHLNRLYLPMTAATYGNSTWAYHRLDIQYKHNWPNSTGIAPSGELNTLRMYIGDGTTAMVHGDTVIDAQFLISASGTLATTTHIFKQTT